MSHEQTETFQGSNGRWYNVPMVGARSGKRLSARQAMRRAAHEGLLGKGFANVTKAVRAAGRRSRDFNDRPETVIKAATRPGGRLRRLHKLEGSRTPFNPGGRSRQQEN